MLNRLLISLLLSLCVPASLRGDKAGAQERIKDLETLAADRLAALERDKKVVLETSEALEAVTKAYRGIAEPKGNERAMETYRAFVAEARRHFVGLLTQLLMREPLEITQLVSIKEVNAYPRIREWFQDRYRFSIDDVMLIGVKPASPETPLSFQCRYVSPHFPGRDRYTTTILIHDRKANVSPVRLTARLRGLDFLANNLIKDVFNGAPVFYVLEDILVNEGPQLELNLVHTLSSLRFESANPGLKTPDWESATRQKVLAFVATPEQQALLTAEFSEYEALLEKQGAIDLYIKEKRRRDAPKWSRNDELEYQRRFYSAKIFTSAAKRAIDPSEEEGCLEEAAYMKRFHNYTFEERAAADNIRVTFQSSEKLEEVITENPSLKRFWKSIYEEAAKRELPTP